MFATEQVLVRATLKVPPMFGTPGEAERWYTPLPEKATDVDRIKMKMQFMDGALRLLCAAHQVGAEALLVRADEPVATVRWGLRFGEPSPVGSLKYSSCACVGNKGWTGTVKSYVPSKGFGFIFGPDGTAEVFLITIVDSRA